MNEFWGLSFPQNEGRDKTRVPLSLPPAAMFCDSDSIPDTEQLRRNGTAACHQAEGPSVNSLVGILSLKQSLSVLLLLITGRRAHSIPLVVWRAVFQRFPMSVPFHS